MLVIHPLLAAPARCAAARKRGTAAEIPGGNRMIFLPITPPSSARGGWWRDQTTDHFFLRRRITLA
jgi:hypothetical protein